jgi:hypothetical protein
MFRRERRPFDPLTLASVVGNSVPRGVGGVLRTGESASRIDRLVALRHE